MAQRKRSKPTALLLHVDSFIYSFLYENRTQLSQVAPSLCFSFYKAGEGGRLAVYLVSNKNIEHCH